VKFSVDEKRLYKSRGKGDRALPQAGVVFGRYRRHTANFLVGTDGRLPPEVSFWMSALGMSVSVDAVGNLRGFYPAASPGGPRILIGSHLDTVPNAGAFDGILEWCWQPGWWNP